MRPASDTWIEGERLVNGPAGADADQLMDQIVLRAERLRSGVMAVLFGSLSVLVALRLSVVAAQGVEVDVGWAVVVIGSFGLVAVYEVALVRMAVRRLRDGRGLPQALPYASTVFEVGAVVAGSALVLVEQGPAFDGAIVLLLLFLAFSMVRISLPLAVFTGATAALGYLILDYAARGAIVEGAVWTAGQIVAGGLGAGLVARAFRRAAVRLVGEARARERLQADLLASVEATQVRIGRELHDSVGSHLTGLSMYARGLVRRVERGGSVERTEAADVADMIDEALRQVRRLSRGLTPSEMEPGGLPSALAALAADTERATGTVVTFRAAGDAPALPAETEGHLYRIAQEAVANALKHGHPNRIAIALDWTDERVELVVEDDGPGVGPNGLPEGVGLRTMRHRADLFGGTFDIRSVRTGGLRVRVTTPLADGALQ